MIKLTLKALALTAFIPLAACDGTIPPPDSVTTESQSTQQSTETGAQTPEPATGTAGAPAGTADDPTDTSDGTTAESSEADTGLDTIATGAEVARSNTFGRIAGRWAETADDCATDGAYQISATRVERPGRVCSVAELIDAGQDSVTTALLCPTGQGDADERELLRLSLQGEALSANIVGSREPPATLQRCPP